MTKSVWIRTKSVSLSAWSGAQIRDSSSKQSSGLGVVVFFFYTLKLWGLNNKDYKCQQPVDCNYLREEMQLCYCVVGGNKWASVPQLQLIIMRAFVCTVVNAREWVGQQIIKSSNRFALLPVFGAKRQNLLRNSITAKKENNHVKKNHKHGHANLGF